MTGRVGRVAICTAITKSFVSHARVLARSLGAVHPDIPVFALVTERADALEGWHERDFESIPIERVDLPDLMRQAFINPAKELTVLAKPLVMRHLLHLGVETVLFLDADVLVLHDLTPLIATSAAHAITLAPHLLEPATLDPVARELAIALAGTFNGGFIGVSARPEAFRFLDWLIERLRSHNRLDPRAGLHHDQRWLNLVPGFFDEVAIVRDPGCNVAYWNLPERRLFLDGGQLLVNGDPCRFFHFSGFDPQHPEVLTKHSTLGTRASVGPAAALMDRYVAALNEAGFEQTSRAPYSYGHFDMGVPIPALARALYHGLGEAAGRFGDPFATAEPGSYLDWLRAPDEGDGPGQGLPRLWRAVYEGRGDLRRAFPDPAGVDQERFEHWIREAGLAEHGMDAAMAP